MVAFLDIHSYGQMWMSPYGYSKEKPSDYEKHVSVQHSWGKGFKMVLSLSLCGTIDGNLIEFFYLFYKAFLNFVMFIQVLYVIVPQRTWKIIFSMKYHFCLNNCVLKFCFCFCCCCCCCFVFVLFCFVFFVVVIHMCKMLEFLISYNRLTYSMKEYNIILFTSRFFDL